MMLPEPTRPTRPLLLAGLTALLLAAGGGVVAQEAAPEGEAPAAEESAESPAPEAASPAAPPVIRIQLESIVHPLAAEFLLESIATADERAAAALVIELNTPGGLLTSTREMTTAMLGAATPVVVWVAPSGAQAASAGFFLLMAADVAAMAPGTNTGAAHPVGGQGEDIEGDMGAKAEEDAAATIRSLAARNGRNAELAESAVVESRSFTADEALELGLVDLVAGDLGTLLAELDGREITKSDGRTVTLETAGAPVEKLEMNAFQRFLAAIAHPNIAYILLTLGGLGLYFELANPGTILPGVVGAICLVLAFFALSVLPINYAGIALLILAAIFFIAEVKVTSFGLLTVAGVISLVLGSVMLFKGAEVDPAVRVSVDVIAAATAVIVLTVIFLTTVVVRAYRGGVRTGSEGLLHEVGEARTDLDPRGRVFIHGEIWSAEAEEPVQRGERVEIAAVDGMTLRVRRQGGATAATPSGTNEPDPEPEEAP